MPDFRLIHGDCLEILPTLDADSVDAVITDPPYPGLKGGLTHAEGGVALRTRPTTTIGTPWGNELEALKEVRRVAKYGAIVFCSWHSLGYIRDLLGGEPIGLVTWYKRNAQPSFRNRPHYQCEYAWLIEYQPGMNWKPIKTHYDIPYLVAGCFASERILEEGTKKAAHPAQKPISLMRALIESSPGSVLDPFMGLGTTGVACHQTGRNFIGIEIDENYYNIACERIAKAQQQMIMEF